MTLTVLGSGTMMPTKGRYPSAYLLETKAARILLDCGHTAVARLVERGVDLHRIDAVAITHFHTDHCSGLLPLIHARWVDDVQRGRAHRPLTVLGPVTLRERFAKLRTVHWPEPGEAYPVRFVEGARTLRLGSVQLTAFPVHHVPWFASVGFRVTERQTSLVYSGDLGSRQGAAFRRAIRGARALLIEAAALRPSPNHFTATQAVALAEECGIPRVLLTHVRAASVPAVRRVVRGRRLVTLVRDGQHLTI